MSLRTKPTGRSSTSVNPSGGRVHLYNEESRRRTVAVVVRGDGHGTTVERTVLHAGGTVRLGLPATDDHLTVSCHSDDGRSAVGTHRPDDVGPVVVSLRERAILLDSG